VDRLRAMVRGTGLRRSVRVGLVVGVGLLATGEYDGVDIAMDGDGRVFFVSSFLLWPGWRISFFV
jgi:hypothetical protein